MKRRAKKKADAMKAEAEKVLADEKKHKSYKSGIAGPSGEKEGKHQEGNKTRVTRASVVCPVCGLKGHKTTRSKFCLGPRGNADGHGRTQNPQSSIAECIPVGTGTPDGEDLIGLVQYQKKVDSIAEKPVIIDPQTVTRGNSENLITEKTVITIAENGKLNRESN